MCEFECILGRRLSRSGASEYLIKWRDPTGGGALTLTHHPHMRTPQPHTSAHTDTHTDRLSGATPHHDSTFQASLVRS